MNGALRRVGGMFTAMVAAGALRAQPSALIGNGTKHVRARVDAISASGTRAEVLVTLAVDPGWHISWRNPGETGLPTRLTWSLPAGVRVVNETWPVPVVAHTAVGATHTLEGDVPWLVEFALDSGAHADRLVSLTARYGVCKDVCIPEQLTVQGVLPGARSSALVAVPAALRLRLSTDGGVVAARRRAPTTLCLARAPLADASALPEVIADSGLGIDAAQRLTRAGNHVFVMNIPASSPLRTGARVLFIRGASAVSARLDFARTAPGCAPR